LADEGLTEGTHYSIEARFLEGDFSRVDPLIRELGSFRPNVIVISAMGITAFHQLYPETPLVFTGVAADPIALGWVKSYSNPGGTITGNVMNAVGGEETMGEKRLALFMQLVPDLKRLALIGPASGPLLVREQQALQNGAHRNGFEVVNYGLKTADDIDSALASALSDEVDAFFISGEPLLFSNLSRVAPLVAAAKKPAFAPYPEWARAGLLLSYSTDAIEGYRNAGVYAGKILKGTKPSELPVQQATKFVLVINQATAKSLGIKVPSTLLALADEVIE
jgi:putative ABC transport system substrate-binding protein